MKKIKNFLVSLLFLLAPLATSADGMGGLFVFYGILVVIFFASLVALSFLAAFVLNRVGKLSLKFDILSAVSLSILYIIIFTYLIPLIAAGAFYMIGDPGGVIGAAFPWLFIVIIGIIISSKYILKDRTSSIFVHALFIICLVILLITGCDASLAASYKIDEATNCKFIGRDYCYNDLARKTKDESYCTKLRDERLKGLCYYDLAIKKSDENLCVDIGRDVKRSFGLYLKDSCFIETAQLKNDWQICTNLESSAKERCMEEFVNSLIEDNKENEIKDKILCSSISESYESYGTRERCYFNLAVNNLDSEGCYDSIYPNQCLFKIALNTLDASFCQNITDSSPSFSDRRNAIAKVSYDIANQCFIVLSSLTNNKDLCANIDARGSRGSVDETASKDFCREIDKYPNMVSEFIKEIFGEYSEEYEQIRKR